MAFVLRGVMNFADGRWSGSWTAGESSAESPFSYACASPPSEAKVEVKTVGEVRAFPVSSSWKGCFSYTAPGKLSKSIADHFSITLRPPEYEGAALRAEGSGRNQVGQYVLVGALDTASGILQVERRYTESKVSKAGKPRVPRQPRAAAAAVVDAPSGPDPSNSASARRSSGRPVKRPRRAFDESGSITPRADDAGEAAYSGDEQPSLAAARFVNPVPGDGPAASPALVGRSPGGGGAGAAPGRARAASISVPTTGSVAALVGGKGGGSGKKHQVRAGTWSAAATLGRQAGAAAGEIYEGELLGGLPQGFGTCVYRNGLMYEGQWVAGRECGQGVISGSDDAVIFQGEVHDGLPHGTGTFYFGNGDRYAGQWRDGLFHGRGVYVSVSGASHDGEWADGQRHGSGTATFPDGSVYHGLWRHGQKHGRGELQCANGFKYSGTWSFDLMDGKGVVLFPDGSSYSGGLREGKRDGRGDYTFPAGQQLSGRWTMDAIDKSTPGTLMIPRAFEIDADAWAFPITLGNDISRIHQRAGFDHRGD